MNPPSPRTPPGRVGNQAILGNLNATHRTEGGIRWNYLHRKEYLANFVLCIPGELSLVSDTLEDV